MKSSTLQALVSIMRSRKFKPCLSRSGGHSRENWAGCRKSRLFVGRWVVVPSLTDRLAERQYRRANAGGWKTLGVRISADELTSVSAAWPPSAMGFKVLNDKQSKCVYVCVFGCVLFVFVCLLVCLCVCLFVC